MIKRIGKNSKSQVLLNSRVSELVAELTAYEQKLIQAGVPVKPTKVSRKSKVKDKRVIAKNQKPPKPVQLIPDFVLHDGLRERRPMPYSAYLQSQHWRIVRDKMLAKAQGRCQQCGSARHLQIHHVNYCHLWYEHSADLRVLCEDCHAILHGWYIHPA